MAVLWFGGAVDMIFPDWDYTHSGPATPLVAGGRMFIQVFPRLHAIDVYTGRRLWTRRIPATGVGTQRRNINYVATEDSVYVASGKKCVRLDAATGATLAEINCAAEEAARWREVRVWKDRLVAAAGNALLCMDRRSGKVGWKYRARGR